jgi:hypothetical protein
MNRSITAFIRGTDATVRTIDDEAVVEAGTEEAFAAALSAALATGVAVHADPAVLTPFGIADHGEDLGDLLMVFPDELPQAG